MNYAWIENNTIRDVIDDPVAKFHPDVAVLYDTEVADDILVNYVYQETDPINNSGIFEWMEPELEYLEPNPLYNPGVYSWIMPSDVQTVDAIVRSTVPVSTTINTATTITVEVLDRNNNDSVIPVNETYFIPLMNKITKEMNQIISVTLVNGIGSTDITITSQGIYDVQEELIRPIPTARLEANNDIVVV